MELAEVAKRMKLAGYLRAIGRVLAGENGAILTEDILFETESVEVNN